MLTYSSLADTQDLSAGDAGKLLVVQETADGFHFVPVLRNGAADQAALDAAFEFEREFNNQQLDNYFSSVTGADAPGYRRYTYGYELHGACKAGTNGLAQGWYQPFYLDKEISVTVPSSYMPCICQDTASGQVRATLMRTVGKKVEVYSPFLQTTGPVAWWLDGCFLPR